MANVLVTGGTGVLGLPTVRRLLDEGFSVTVVSRRRPSISSGRLTWIQSDVCCDTSRTLQNLGRVDFVVHAAAHLADDDTFASMSAHRKTNIEFSELLFDWCKERAVKQVVYFSGFHLLQRPLALPITERHPVAPTTPYGISKYWGELLLQRASQEAAFAATIFRISSPVPDAFDLLPATVLRTWLTAARNGEPIRVFGSGNRTQNFIACGDVATGVLLALRSSDANGLFNIAASDDIRMRDLAQAIASIRKTRVVFEGVDTRENERWNISIEKAKNELGFRPQLSSLEVVTRLAKQIL